MGNKIIKGTITNVPIGAIFKVLKTDDRSLSDYDKLYIRVDEYNTFDKTKAHIYAIRLSKEKRNSYFMNNSTTRTFEILDEI